MGMSEEERQELSKKMYLEVKQIFECEMLKMRDWMREVFVCSTHCQEREKKIDRSFFYVYILLITIGFSIGIEKLLPLIIKGAVGV